MVDKTPPAVTINQAAGQADPTNTSPINFTAVFAEPVTGFTGGDVSLSGTAAATTTVVTAIAPFDGTTYNVAVSGMTSDGTVIATIPAGTNSPSTSAAQDAAANGNDASTGTDNTAAVTINHAPGQADPTNSARSTSRPPSARRSPASPPTMSPSAGRPAGPRRSPSPAARRPTTSRSPA